MVALMDGQEIREFIKAKLDSREWWILFDLRSRGHLEDLEERFYNGDKNGDFHVLMGGDMPGFGCTLALKKHCPPQEMVQWLADMEGPVVTPEILEKQDVIVLTAGDTPREHYENFILSWQAWLFHLDL